MYWSKYNILHKSEKYGYLLFNTMSQVFLKIPDSEIDVWQELRTNPESYNKIKGSDFLFKSRIIVPDQEEDLNMYVTDVLKNRFNSADVALTVLPTRGCNFGCIYCYEIERPHIQMDKETEEGMIRFLESNPNMKRLNVVWYGGEPLLNFQSIERLSRSFLKMGIEYTARIITNGYLLTKETADLFESLHIEKVQITFDGTENTHNSRRPLLDGGATYRRILDNMKYLLAVNPSIHIDLRTNIDRRNMQEYTEFLRQFKQEINDPRVRTYPGFVSDLLSNECVDPVLNICEGGLKAEFMLNLYKNHGIAIEAFLPQYRIHSCVANKYFGFVIGPEGEVYKCWRSVGHPDQVVGNVKDGAFDMYKYANYLSNGDFTRDPKCMACTFVAICGGGCPLIRIRNKRENADINPCCPEKTHMAKLMEMRYEMFLDSNKNDTSIHPTGVIAEH